MKIIFQNKQALWFIQKEVKTASVWHRFSGGFGATGRWMWTPSAHVYVM